jgi:rod shape determining protein RodA
MTTPKGDKTGNGIVDRGSIAIFFLLMVIGWVNIYAAVFDESATEGFSFASRYGSQLIWIGVCVVASVVIMLIDDIYYHIASYPLYVFMVLMLIATLLVGTEVNGAKSWIRFGGFQVQPVEFAKFATALAMAKLISSYSFSLANMRSLLSVAAVIGIPGIIIILQNDTGSAIVFAAFVLVLFREGLNGWLYIGIGMLIFLFVFSFVLTPGALLACIILICVLMEAIMHRRWKISAVYIAGVAFFSTLLHLLLNALFTESIDFYWSLLVCSLLSLGVVALHAWRERLKTMLFPLAFFVGSLVFTGATDYVFDNMLQLHQQKRILNLLGVESDTQKWGYNVNQSKIAIGSGGFWGKGYLDGTQTQYNFVPEQSTDFIFCTVGEEWGFVGSAVVLLLFGWLIVRLVIMGERQQEPFGRVYCYCVAAIFLFHVIVNVGMAIGIMPVIGIPLPLFSYGGSSLLAFTILFFVAIKLDSRKRETDEFLRGK